MEHLAAAHGAQEGCGAGREFSVEPGETGPGPEQGWQQGAVRVRTWWGLVSFPGWHCVPGSDWKLLEGGAVSVALS